MRDRIVETDNTDLVVVVFTDPSNLADYRRRHQLDDLQIVIDPQRAAYRAFGIDRGALHRIWGFRAIRRYLEIFRTDGFGGLARPTEDTRQLGGDFVIAADGTLVYGSWPEGPGDRAHVAEIVAALP